MDAGPPVWLDKIGYLNILPYLYDIIFIPESVLRELRNLNKKRYFRDEALNFVKRNFTPIELDRDEKRRSRRLVKRWARKYDADETDAQVFIAYRDYVRADDMLFANKGAERIFGRHGSARDIIKLYELAQRVGLWKQEESAAYVQKLIEANYRTPNAKRVLDQIGARAF